MKNNKMYHVSSPKSRESIRMNGLLPRVGNQRAMSQRNDIPLIYATAATKLEYLFNSTFDDDIWEIDLSKTNNEWTEDSEMFTPHFHTDKPISTDAITLVYRGSGRDMEFINGDAMTKEEIKRRNSVISKLFK